MASLSVKPIGFLHGGRAELFDDHWGQVRASILLDADRFSVESLAGLADFSHIEILFYFHRVAEEEISRVARHPRGRTDWPKTGIFAQRNKARPNRIGLTVCRLLRIENLTLSVEGLDAIDGTPVLDIKPWMSGFGPRGPVREPDWAREILREYW